MSKAVLVVALAMFAGVMFAWSEFVKWGVHAFGPLQFMAVAKRSEYAAVINANRAKLGLPQISNVIE